MEKTDYNISPMYMGKDEFIEVLSAESPQIMDELAEKYEKYDFYKVAEAVNVVEEISARDKADYIKSMEADIVTEEEIEKF